MPYKIKSVTDTPAERVAHSLKRIPPRQSPTPLGPGRNDLFHARIPTAFIRQVFDVIADTPRHTYQLLTKRPKRSVALADTLPWPPNLWLGVSVESSETRWRIDELRKIPAAVRFISAEPLLGPLPNLDLDGIHWVIAGGESGRGHRPAEEAWLTDIRDQCAASQSAFFFKQWGGARSKSNGRELQGRVWNEMPSTESGSAVA